MAMQIGAPNWRDHLIASTRRLGAGFWDRFTPVSDQRLASLERELGRKLPVEFKEFYRTVGYGNFSPGSCFYSPDDIVACLGAPIYFVRGSLTPGAQWATEDEHRRLWISRGSQNPNPGMFTEEALTLDGIRLYDLLQIGADGLCNYHQLYVGNEPAPFSYCLLTESSTIENVALSLSEALEAILQSHLSDLSD